MFIIPNTPVNSSKIVISMHTYF